MIIKGGFMKEAISCNQKEFFSDCDSGTIQNAIEAAIKDGCRKVVIPRYNLRTNKNEWRISKAIEIPSNMTLFLDNCYMVQETGVMDNMFKNSLAHAEHRTKETEQHDISIIGVGNVCISGGVHNGLLERNSQRYGLPGILKNNLFYWVNVRNLRVENLHIEHQRHWAMTHIFCEYVILKNLDFYAVPHVPNMDGIDLRIGCNHFEIENITGRTGDDTIAMTAMLGVIEKDAFVQGKPTDICDVNIKNVLSDPFRMINVRILNQDGNKVHDIHIDTIMDTSDYATKAKGIAPVSVGTQGLLYVQVCRAKQEDTKNIHVRNIYTRASMAVRFDDVCSDSTFTNLKMFNTCFLGLSTSGFGTSLKNVTVDSIYCGSMKTDAQRGRVDGYTPTTIVSLPMTKGDLVARNIYTDGIEYLCNAEAELNVKFENCSTEGINKICERSGKTKMTINGKEYKGD